MNNGKFWTIKKTLLLLCSSVLLVSGSTLLYNAVPMLQVFSKKSAELQFTQSQEPIIQPVGKFVLQGMDRFDFNDAGKDLFGLLVAHYKDAQDVQRSAILFPKDKQEGSVFSTPTGLRHSIWEEAALTMSSNAAKDALILSWWDDGQRVHFLSNLNAWLTKPAAATFVGPVWKVLQPQLPLASAEENQRLSSMAVWLTMDADKALAEITAHFGKSQPVYLLVTNDLLLRQGELIDYGGHVLAFNSKNIPAGDDLHGDIAQVKRWAAEGGEGNYLVQKEGAYYRAWTPSNPETKNALLVRLLPFMDSLKHLPPGVQQVYQSGGGGYLSIYRLNG